MKYDEKIKPFSTKFEISLLSNDVHSQGVEVHHEDGCVHERVVVEA